MSKLKELNLIERKKSLFEEDIDNNSSLINEIISNSTFLIIGGAGSIGQATVKEIFKRSPKKLYVVDISENNLVELVRDLRSSMGYIKGDFKTFVLDVSSLEFDLFIRENSYFDYVLNLSALKHVRSERDPYTLMRLINVNILNSIKISKHCLDMKSKNFFSVSTDKSSNPVNLMGASKKIMELFLLKNSEYIKTTMSRFANVAFSDGSLLHGFIKRMEKKQPLSAPYDVERYFISSSESGELCMLSCLLGNNRDIFYPKTSSKLKLLSIKEITIKFLNSKGYDACLCESEDEARKKIDLINKGLWPCYFFKSDTTGEKPYEEFYTQDENINQDKFINIGVIKNNLYLNNNLNVFLDKINEMKIKKSWSKEDIVDSFKLLIDNFNHYETNKNLDNKM